MVLIVYIAVILYDSINYVLTIVLLVYNCISYDIDSVSARDATPEAAAAEEMLRGLGHRRRLYINMYVCMYVCI